MQYELKGKWSALHGLDDLDVPAEHLYDFMRGVVSTIGRISVRPPSVAIQSPDATLIGFLSGGCSIPHTQTQNELTFTGGNAIDLLGRVYPHPWPTVFNQILSDRDEFPSCKVFKRLSDAHIPSKTSFSDVGLDLVLVKKVRDVDGMTALYDTGIALQTPLGYYAEIVPRSSLSKSGYMMTNSVGIIDNGYRGTLMISLTKINPSAPSIQLPFRCCQLIFKPQVYMPLVIATSPDETSRGAGGFGSTGL